MNELGTKILKYSLTKAKGMPKDFVQSLQAATNISPPVDLYRRLQTNKAFLPYGGVPFKEQMNFSLGNLKDAKKASHLVGYAAPLRPFMSNPLKLVSGESARRLSTGRGWEIFDRVLNK